MKIPDLSFEEAGWVRALIAERLATYRKELRENVGAWAEPEDADIEVLRARFKDVEVLEKLAVKFEEPPEMWPRA